jgi:solute carrier family 6 GABA transporter-like protein 6/8/11/12/13
MDSGSEEATNPQQGPETPVTVTNLEQNNMTSGSAHSASQNLKRASLSLVIPKGDNDNDRILSNKHLDKVHDKNEENRRLLGTGGVSRKKIVIVPSLSVGTVVSTNGVKQSATVAPTGNNDSVSVGIHPTPNGGILKTEDSRLENRNGTGSRKLRPPQLVPEFQLSGLDESLRAGHTLPLTISSLRSLKLEGANCHQPIIGMPGPNWRSSFCFSEAASHISVRSLASIGMGSTDGRKVTIRRVPTTPTELFNIVQSPT